MTLRRIQSSRVFRALSFSLFAAAVLVLPARSPAQGCTGTLQSATQTYTINSSGSGNFSPSFTQYSPPPGYTLLGAAFQSSITMTATFQLTNPNPADETIKVGVNDEDEMSVDGSDITDPGGDDISDEIVTKTNFGSVLVPANGGTAQVGPAVAFNNKSVIYDSITTAYGQLNSFVGTGNVNMSYNISSGFSVNGAVNVVPTYVVTTQLRLTYYFCYTGTLAADFLSFTATRENAQTVGLNWSATNESPGRKYVVQVSPGNGTDFASVATVAAGTGSGDGNYSYAYNSGAFDTGRLYFRLQLVNVDGSVAYSPLRIVNLGGGASAAAVFSLYPNPPDDYINLALPGDARQWQVDIFAPDGGLVQRNFFSNTSVPRVTFNRKLTGGTYYVRAMNPQTGEQHTGSFIIP